MLLCWLYTTSKTLNCVSDMEHIHLHISRSPDLGWALSTEGMHNGTEYTYKTTWLIFYTGHSASYIAANIVKHIAVFILLNVTVISWARAYDTIYRLWTHEPNQPPTVGNVRNLK